MNKVSVYNPAGIVDTVASSHKGGRTYPLTFWLQRVSRLRCLPFTGRNNNASPKFNLIHQSPSCIQIGLSDDERCLWSFARLVTRTHVQIGTPGYHRVLHLNNMYKNFLSTLSRSHEAKGELLLQSGIRNRQRGSGKVRL